ncbi:MAG: acyltransferase family protein [Nitrospiraceae bacterium]
MPHQLTSVPPPSAAALAQRSGSFDVIRVSACLAVVLLHLAATTVMQPEQLGTISWHMANFIDSAMRWAVPVFVMLSGALLLDEKKQTSPREFWTRRMNRLLPALLFWSAVYLAWRAFFWHQPLTLNTIALDLIAGRPYIHLYFLFLIAGLYLVTPFLAMAATSLDSKHLSQAILVMAALALGANLADFLATSIFTMFVPYIAYYFAGLYCVRVLASSPGPYGLLLAGAIATTILLTAFLVSVKGLNDHWAFYFYEDFSPTIMVMAVTLFMVLLRATFSPIILSVAQRLAPLTLGVYVAHPIIVELLRNLYHTTMPAMFRPLYYIPITFAATIVITFAAVALMQKAPILRRVT